MTTFNLLDSPWIPCMGADGRRLELGIRAVLSRAHELREVRDESPLTTMALMRLLLAVTHAALEGPADLATWKRLWSAGHLPEKRITAYLDKWQGRFDLFDPKYPFFQVGGFEVVDKDGQAKEPTPVTKLTHERATGNSATLFDHSVEESEIAVSPSVAARWLVTCQSYALGGGVGGTSNKFGKHPNFTHAPMVGGVAVVLDGSSLFETLMLNLVVGAESGPIPSKGHDAPVWERDRIDSPEERRPRGLLEFLTWRARMVRLLPVTANGAVLVKQMQYAPGWEVAEDVVNPAWAYVTDEKRGERPIGLRQGRVLWRDSSALLTAAQAGGAPPGRRPIAVTLAAELVELGVLPPQAMLKVSTFGFENDKAKPLLWRRETWSVPASLVKDEAAATRLVVALGVADAAGKAAYASLSRFMEQFKDSLEDVRSRGMAAYWAALDEPFRRLAVGLAATDRGPELAWARAVAVSARRAVERVTDNAHRRSARELQARVAAGAILEAKLRPIEHMEEN